MYPIFRPKYIFFTSRVLRDTGYGERHRGDFGVWRRYCMKQIWRSIKIKNKPSTLLSTFMSGARGAGRGWHWDNTHIKWSVLKLKALCRFHPEGGGVLPFHWPADPTVVAPKHSLGAAYIPPLPDQAPMAACLPTIPKSKNLNFLILQRLELKCVL